MKLYKKFVRPHLEFAVTAWSPWTEADKECLEKVVRPKMDPTHRPHTTMIKIEDSNYRTIHLTMWVVFYKQKAYV